MLGLCMIGAACSMAASEPPPQPEGWASMEREERREALIAAFDLSNPQINPERLLAGGPWIDGIPPLTDPERADASTAEWPGDDARVVEVVVNDEAVAYPLAILNFHEIANDEVGGVPIAAVYCPLCDSVSVYDRRLELADGEEIVLEFGVSGMLYNSNVVMYERSTMGLWSQVYMQAVSGPHAGMSLEHLPVRVVGFDAFKRAHPEGEVLTRETGHERPYDRNPYAGYFADPDYVFPGVEYDDRLPPKTLGMGVRVGDEAIFVPASAGEGKPFRLETPAGEVVMVTTDAGITAERVPEDVDVVQTFYHSWSGFFPKTRIVPEP